MRTGWPMPRSKRQKIRSLDDIEQVWRHGWGLQRMCGCQTDDEGPCTADDPNHADVDFGPPLTKDDLKRLCEAKRSAYRQGVFGGEEDNGRAYIDWLEFEREYKQYNSDTGRTEARKTKRLFARHIQNNV